jgi:hypothetical protein
MIELAEVLARHWPGYEARFGARILPSHRAAVEAILCCRTAALGGQLYGCGQCGQFHYAYHSCGHRACPRCGHDDATAWIEQQKTRLLPGVPYFLVTFTVPEELRAIIRSQQKEWYGVLFRESAATLQDVAANPKQLGAQLGMLGVLHTWGRQLQYHPHIHYVVAGGGLSEDGLQWKRVKSAEYLLTEPVLSARFRTRLKAALRERPAWWAQVPPAAWRKGWVVDCIAVGSGESALKYLAAYVYKTALGRQRILRDDDGRITFTYRESESGATKALTVEADEFLRRFLQHVLPKGFPRVRYFGWLAPAAQARRERIEALLDWKRPAPRATEPVPPPSCPQCRQPMVRVAELPRAPP